MPQLDVISYPAIIFMLVVILFVWLLMSYLVVLPRLSLVKKARVQKLENVLSLRTDAKSTRYAGDVIQRLLVGRLSL